MAQIAKLDRAAVAKLEKKWLRVLRGLYGPVKGTTTDVLCKEAAKWLGVRDHLREKLLEEGLTRLDMQLLKEASGVADKLLRALGLLAPAKKKWAPIEETPDEADELLKELLSSG